MDHRAKNHPSNKICKNMDGLMTKIVGMSTRNWKISPPTQPPLFRKTKTLNAGDVWTITEVEMSSWLTTPLRTLALLCAGIGPKTSADEKDVGTDIVIQNRIRSFPLCNLCKKNRIFHQFRPHHRPGLKWQHRIYLNSQPRTSHWSKRWLHRLHWGWIPCSWRSQRVKSKCTFCNKCWQTAAFNISHKKTPRVFQTIKKDIIKV